MRARDIMTTNVATLAPQATVAEAARLLVQRHVSGAPVVDKNGALVGIVSEGDFLRRPEVVGDARPSWWLQLLRTETEQARDYMRQHSRRVEDVMTREVATVGEDTEVAEIARLLERKRIKRAPVVRDGKVVGIVSRADLLRMLAARGPELAQAPAPSDAELRRRVLDALEREPWGAAATLNVTVSDGRVTLWGIVNSPEARRAARVAVENLPGVREVEVNFGTLPEWAWAD